MAVTATPIYAQKIQSWAYAFLPAVTTTKETIVSAGSNGSQVTSLFITSNDSAQSMQFYLYDGTTYHNLAYIAITANAGTAALTQPVDAFRNVYFAGLQLDPFGNKVLNIPSGWSLVASMIAAVNTGKQIDVIAQGGDY